MERASGSTWKNFYVIKIHAKVIKTIDHTVELLRSVKYLNERHTLVGVPAEKTARDSKGAKGTPPTNSFLAYVHNYGSPAANIPARPFMEPGIKNAEAQIADQMKKASTAAGSGDQSGVDRGLNGAGIVAATSIKAKITDGPFVPLAPSTLRARRSRGRKGTRPLIDTGQLRNSITYVVRKK